MRSMDAIDTGRSYATRAAETAYKAVMKPKEGTILTVAKGSGRQGGRAGRDGRRSGSIYSGSDRACARKFLSQTPEMLPVLKEAGVVDSGGQGLAGSAA